MDEAKFNSPIVFSFLQIYADASQEMFCFRSETALSRLGAAIAASWLKAELIVGQDSGVPSSLTGHNRNLKVVLESGLLRFV